MPVSGLLPRQDLKKAVVWVYWVPRSRVGWLVGPDVLSITNQTERGKTWHFTGFLLGFFGLFSRFESCFH